MSERSGDGWYGKLGGNCPVQGWGRVDDHAWYFRARGDCWRMEIAYDRKVSEDDLPNVWPPRFPGWIVEEDWGTWPEAGYMEECIAWQLIETTIARLRAGELKLAKRNWRLRRRR